MAKHRLLVVGVGSIGERHLRCFQKTGRCEVAICEPNGDLREAVSKRYGVSQGYQDVEAAYAGERFDVAVIATPAPLHVPLAMRLAERGMHLLIEKPLSTSLDGIEELRQLVVKRSLVTAVGYTHRANAAVLAVKQALESGRFGRLLQLVVTAGQPFDHFRPAYRDIYFARREDGGGAVQDAMTHLFSVGEWFAGPMERLVTDAAHLNLAGVDVEDTVHTLARHGAVMASYSINLYQPANEITFTLNCETGMLRTEYAQSRWSWMDKPVGKWNHTHVDFTDPDVPYVAQASRFLDAIESNGTPLCTLEEGAHTLRVNLAALRSMDEGAWQRV